MVDRDARDGRGTIWLGDSEGSPPHWGGAPRPAVVRGRSTLASGATGLLVSIDPPLPRSDGPPLAEAILMTRYDGDRLDALGDRPVIVNVLRPAEGVDIRKPAFEAGELVIQFWADAAASREALPEPIDVAAFWQETLERIRRFIEEHGHSRVPENYHDADGRLDVLVGNLRWHHAGKGGVSPGPFPGIDYAQDLERLRGWEWERLEPLASRQPALIAAGDLDRLRMLLPEPSVPVEAPVAGDWDALHERLGYALPADYQAFIDQYGSGVIDGFAWVLNPFSANENIRFPEASDRQLAILRWVREQGTETLPYQVHPEAGGLALWAETANGDCFYWVTDGPPDGWRVTVNESRAPNWHDHPGPMSALLADLLDGSARIEFFPDNFPLAEHSFEAF